MFASSLATDIDVAVDADPAMRGLLAHLLTLPPDAFVMNALLTIDRTALSDVDAVTFLQLHQRVAAWWASVQAEVVLVAASPEPKRREGIVLAMKSEEERTVWIEEWRREELALTLRLSPATAQGLIDTARFLAGPLPRTAGALRSGEVTDRHVAAIVRAAERLPGRWQRTPDETAEFYAACAELERRVLPTARRTTVAKTVAAANRAVLVIDAEGERRRREAAKPRRDVWVWEDVDGLAQFGARMSTEHAHALLARIDCLAYADANRDGADPTLTIGERRAQALIAAVLGTSTEGARHVIKADVSLVIDLPTFLALAGDTAGVAELRGAGPVAAEVVRDLLADPDVDVTLRRLITDPTIGHLLDYGRTTYRIPQALRDFVVARDGVCRFPGCSRRADRSELDHATPWDDGGTTSPDNLGALCIRHHQLKTHCGWTITDSRADGSCVPKGREPLRGSHPTAADTTTTHRRTEVHRGADDVPRLGHTREACYLRTTRTPIMAAPMIQAQHGEHPSKAAPEPGRSSRTIWLSACCHAASRRERQENAVLNHVR